jgi:hypothetical protein
MKANSDPTTLFRMGSPVQPDIKSTRISGRTTRNRENISGPLIRGVVGKEDAQELAACAGHWSGGISCGRRDGWSARSRADFARAP